MIIMKIKLKSIEEELIDCRAAFAAHPEAKFGWCIHHEVLFEQIDKEYGVEGRIACIMNGKAEGERAIRLRNFRPARVEIPRALIKAATAYYKACAAEDKASAAYDEARAACREAWTALDKATAAYDEATAAYDEARAACEPELKKLRDQDWPDNTWNGKSIFSKE